MAQSTNVTGYGPRRDIPGRYGRLCFDGDERKFEQWEIKFLGYMRLQKLKDTIVASGDDEIDDDKNAEAFAELMQFLDDKSLSCWLTARQFRILNLLQMHLMTILLVLDRD